MYISKLPSAYFRSNIRHKKQQARMTIADLLFFAERTLDQFPEKYHCYHYSLRFICCIVFYFTRMLILPPRGIPYEICVPAPQEVSSSCSDCMFNTGLVSSSGGLFGSVSADAHTLTVAIIIAAASKAVAFFVIFVFFIVVSSLRIIIVP